MEHADLKTDYDLIVIGAGSGGVRAARMSASKGARVAVIEERFLGGTCVNVGCVPKKLFVYASHFAETFEDAQGFGWAEMKPNFDWTKLVHNKNVEIERLNGIYQKLLVNAGVEIIDGRGVLSGPNTVKVGDSSYTAKHILVATGSQAVMPNIPGKEWASISDALFYLKKLPATAVIVGGGYIAVEFAGVLAGLGVETHLIYRGRDLLKRFDADIREALTAEIIQKGIHLHLEDNVQEVFGSDEFGCQEVLLTSGQRIKTQLALFATGRQPYTGGLGLEEAGVSLSPRGAIEVDENYATNVKSIYAVGDVIDRVQLTPVALGEGMYVANHLFGDEPVPVDYDTIPTAVFSQPSVGTVGPSEAEAREKYAAIKVYRSSFRALKNTLSGNPEKTTMKLIVDSASDRVVAAHMVGPEAAEIIQGVAIAIRAGATKQIFDTTVGIHPSSAEEFVTMREPVSD